MKIIFALLMLAALSVSGQEKIVKGTPVKIDGIIEPGEWKDAAAFTFRQSGDIKCSFKVKHDGGNINVLYEMRDFKDSTILLPEIFIDTGNNGGEKWNEDDAWFHVSAQDCFAMGKREDYSGCKVEGAGWSAVPNYPFGRNWKRIEAIEITIPFEKIRVKKGSVIGVCFSIAIFPGDIRHNFPKDSSEDIPSTWGRFVIE